MTRHPLVAHNSDAPWNNKHYNYLTTPVSPMASLPDSDIEGETGTGTGTATATARPRSYSFENGYVIDEEMKQD